MKDLDKDSKIELIKQADKNGEFDFGYMAIIKDDCIGIADVCNDTWEGILAERYWNNFVNDTGSGLLESEGDDDDL